MGIIRTTLELSHAGRSDLASISVTALVDTGAQHLCIPNHVALQLQLSALEQREVTLASGQTMLVPYVGPVKVHFGNRSCFVGALVLGDEALLGAIPMEDLDLIVIPSQLKVAINPRSPNIPLSVAKGMLA